MYGLNGVGAEAAEKAHVLVTVAPYKCFIDAIAQGTIQVDVVVPPAASSHSFEPTPRQMLDASNASLWFVIGDPFERKMSIALRELNPLLAIVDLRQGIEGLKIPHSHHCHSHHDHPHEMDEMDEMDVHIWLSPKRAKIQAQKIKTALVDAFPEQEELFDRGLEQLLSEMDKLDKEIAFLLSACQGQPIMVSHAAFAYFCEDYGLEQLSVECEGKDPSTQTATKVLDAARDLKVQTVFMQKQYSNKGAFRIAQELGLKTAYIDPYAIEYFENMRHMARLFFDESQ